MGIGDMILASGTAAMLFNASHVCVVVVNAGVSCLIQLVKGSMEMLC